MASNNNNNNEQQKFDEDFTGSPSSSSSTTTCSSSSSSVPPPPPAPAPQAHPCANPSLIGRSVADASDWINSNLIAVRYGVMATIGLLTMYGVSQTPLFFRFSNVKDIPNSYFVKQKSLSCRLIRIQQQQQARQQPQGVMYDGQGAVGKRQQETSIAPQRKQRQPIRMWVRHLSPAESWLFMSVVPSSWFDWYMKFHPQATGGANRRPDENKSELLLVQVAGIDAPVSPPYGLLTGTEWLQKNLLEKQQQTLVTCQLLERQRLSSAARSPHTGNALDGDEEEEEEPVDMAAVKVYFRPNPWQFFSTDLAQYLVRNGLANPVVVNQMSEKTGDSNRTSMNEKQQQLRQRRAESYIQDLQRAEMDAAKESRGMWSDPVIRQERRDIMDEVEFQTSATTGQKVWRWIKQAWQRRKEAKSSGNNNNYRRDNRD